MARSILSFELVLLIFATITSATLKFGPTPVNFEGDKDVHVNAVATGNLPVQTASITLRAQNSDFAFDLAQSLPSIPYTVNTLSTVPSSCLDYTATGKSPNPECPAGNTMSATSVTFQDCGSTFTVCRCDNSSSMAMDEAVKMFSQVPVGVRRFVNTVVLMPDSNPHAYTLTTGDIHMFSTTALDTWIHESTHALDYATPSTPISGSNGWLSALGSDSCVPDTYSQTNAIEDFAQMGVLKMYALAHNGQLPPTFDNQCMRAQLAFIDSLPQYNATIMFGNTCHITDPTAAGERGGITTGYGAKHSAAPTNPSPSSSPFPNSNTTTASGFVKLPASTGDFGAQATAGVVAAGSDPSRLDNAASPANAIASSSVLGLVTALGVLLGSVVF